METATLERRSASNVTVKLTELDRQRIHAVATYKNRTAHFIMREAIEHYLQIEESEQAVLKIVDDAAQHYDTTGLHIRLDEFKSWVDSVKTNPHATLSECHT